MSNSNRSTVLATLRRLIWPDLKSTLDQKFRLLVETLVGVPFVCLSLWAFGVGVNSFIEGVVFTVIGALMLVVVHVFWSVAQVPWRLYCDLQQSIADLAAEIQANKAPSAAALRKEKARLIAEKKERQAAERKLAELQAKATKEAEAKARMETIRALLLKHADEAPIANGTPGISKGWAKGAHSMIRNSLQQKLVGKFRWSGTSDLKPNELLEAQAELRSIAGNLQIKDLKT